MSLITVKELRLIPRRELNEGLQIEFLSSSSISLTSFVLPFEVKSSSDFIIINFLLNEMDAPSFLLSFPCKMNFIFSF